MPLLRILQSLSHPSERKETMPYHQEDKISNKTTTIDQLVPFPFDNMLHFDNRRIWSPCSTQFIFRTGS